MKKIYFTVIVLALTITSCSEDFIETKNLFEKDLNNFYKTPEDIEEAMAGVYYALTATSALGDDSVVANLLSDMMLGGGGPDDVLSKNVDAFIDPVDDTHLDLWIKTYNGVTRANSIIERVTDLDLKPFFDTQTEADNFKNQALGEAYFMRAYYYFRAAKFFGGMPLILKIDDSRDVPRSTFTETFEVIASDLKQAIALMPPTNIAAIPSENYGHATKWAAEAYMARVFLFYTGYMTNIENVPTSDLPLMDGGSVTKTEVISYLDDCIANSGHRLAEDFRNLWPYSYVNESAGSTVLPWAENEGLNWVGQDGVTTSYGTGNYETIFSVRFAFGNFSNANARTNRLPLFFGIRGNPSLIPFGEGWGWGPVNPKIWNEWDDADPRKVGSIIELGNADQGTAGYEPGKGDHETGLFNKKYSSLQHNGVQGVKGMFSYIYGNFTDKQLWHAHDYITMRFADVLLMHSEISETADGLNTVRDRAGLAPVGYSLAALKEERLHELAFEGIRWFDIVRWGDVNSAFNEEITVRNQDVLDATYKVNYRPETKGLVSIPESEISLSGGVYKQNPGW